MNTKWIVDPAEDLPLAVIENTEDGLGVCEVGERTPENTSRANLIASAPELLEFAHDVLRYVEAGGISTKSDRQFVARRAYELIAKAKGE